MSTVVVAFGVLLLVTLPASFGEARRYERAERCAGPGREPPTCVEVVPGVVERVHSTRGGRGGRDFHLDLRVGETATFPPFRQPKQVEIEDTTGEPADEDRDEPVYEAFRAGDRVDIGYWGRQLARVTKPGVGSVETIASPVFDAGVALALGPLLPLLGGLGWWGALGLRRRSGSWRTKASFSSSRPSAGRVVGVTSVVGISLLAILLADGIGTDVTLLVLVWVFGALGGATLGGIVLAIGAVVRRIRD